MWDHSGFRAWFVAETLPLWLDRGYDRQYGGFHEKLNFDLTPITDAGKRMMVQARQCYAFTLFKNEVSGAAEIANSGFDFLLSHGGHPDGGWRHSVAQDGTAKDDSRDLYDQAFALFACAWMYGAFGRKEALAAAQTTLSYLDEERAHPAGGFSENILPDGSAADTARRQNPHMHLFEAILVLYDATQDTEYLARAERLFELARSKFMVDGTLREYFTDSLDPAPGAAGRITEPGHHMEWVWLLHRYAALSNNQAAVSMADDLYSFALTSGYDRSSGGLLDEVLCDGSVHRDDRRLWPQTEALKGHIARWEHAGGQTALRGISAGLQSLMQHHLVDGAGKWHEHVRADGANFYGSYPASSLYHMGFAVAELDRASRSRR